MKKYPSMNAIAALCVALIFSAVVIGCSDSGSTTTTENKGPVTPKAGSTYTYNKHIVDSSTTSTQSDEVVACTILSSDSAYKGRDSVIFQVNNNDTLIYVYEANGDISVYIDKFETTIAGNALSFANPSPWVRFTFGSKASGTAIFPHDSTILPTPIGDQTLDITGVANYIGTQSVTLNDNSTLAGSKAEIQINVSGRNLLSTVMGHANRTLTFCNSIGSFTKIESDVYVTPIALVSIPGERHTRVSTLASFSLIK